MNSPQKPGISSCFNRLWKNFCIFVGRDCRIQPEQKKQLQILRKGEKRAKNNQLVYILVVEYVEAKV